MKLKTNKSVSSRFKITGNKKFLRRPVNQDHFNAKDSGNKTRAKRRMKGVSSTDVKHIKRLLPYNG